jgi:chloramphenicol-sensitive protein RarD
MRHSSPEKTRPIRLGTIAAFAAYGMWGLFPLYWKQVAEVRAVEVLCHRVVWSCLFLLVVLGVEGRFGEILGILRHRASALAAAGCSALICVNWGVYIWAVQMGRVTESSLGYYITPILAVALGALFFHEKLDRWTLASVALAALGVAATALQQGHMPWVAVILATSFALYGALKKKANLDALAGLTAETLVSFPFALAYLAWVRGCAMPGSGARTAVLLVLGGPITAVPLLIFAYAAVRIPLQRLGFIQYLSPTLQLLIGIFILGERLTASMAIAFGTVLGAVGLYVLTRPRRIPLVS